MKKPNRSRDRNQPILLFGESETEAFRRLRKLEVQEPELEKGFRNDFQEAMEKVDQVYLQELLRDGDQKDAKSRHDVAIKDEGMTHDEMLVSVRAFFLPNLRISDSIPELSS